MHVILYYVRTYCMYPPVLTVSCNMYQLHWILKIVLVVAKMEEVPLTYMYCVSIIANSIAQLSSSNF